ncbi:MAG: DUF192 domain-containing protein [Alphaproteobacteria bacterium]|jgi:uncharacterized membrane protein (UPF0127 family)
MPTVVGMWGFILILLPINPLYSFQMIYRAETFFRRLLVTLIAPCVMFAALAVVDNNKALGEGFDTAPLWVRSDGIQHRFTVEIAKNEPQRRQGLMYRPSLAPDRGMLFIYGREQKINMWMANTLIPLDMFFINDFGGITYIHERAAPGSKRIISSSRKASYVLELIGGSASRLGIKPGDRVIYKGAGWR